MNMLGSWHMTTDSEDNERNSIKVANFLTVSAKKDKLSKKAKGLEARKNPGNASCR